MGDFYNLICGSFIEEFVYRYVFRAFELAEKNPLFSSQNKKEENFSSELIKIITEEMEIDTETVNVLYHPLHWNLVTNQPNSPLEIYHNGRNDILHIRPSRNYTKQEKENLARTIFEKERLLIANKLELFLTQQKGPVYQI